MTARIGLLEACRIHILELMGFQISALPKQTFEHLFALTDEELKSRGALRTTVTKKPGFPCRVGLTDGEIGEEIILTHYEHQSAESPFRASHAVYVRPHAETAQPAPNTVPDQLRSRVLSLRAFDDQGMLIASDIPDGTSVEALIERLFEDPNVAYIHAHYAKPGCYAARIDRN